MKTIFALCLSLTMIAAALPARAAGTDGIAAVVNDQPILMSAVADRMKLVMISSGMPNTDDMREKIRPQVINMLIDETLRMQEAKNQDITVDEAAIEEGFAHIAEQNEMDSAQFAAVLRNSGINARTLRDQIRAQIAWGRVVQERLHGQVEVSDFDVDTVMQQLRDDIGKTEYLAAEIFLPVDTPADDGEVRQLAERLVAQLKQGQARFSAVAGQFSQAAGAQKGGDMGWVQQGQLLPELEEALTHVDRGQITPPVRTLMGYHILLVRDKRTTTEETMPAREDVFNRVGMQNLERVQRRHFLNLKASAFIERRGV